MKSFEIDTDHNIIAVQEEDGANFSLSISGYSGYTYLSRQEMLNLIDGLREIVGNE